MAILVIINKNIRFIVLPVFYPDCFVRYGISVKFQDLVNNLFYRSHASRGNDEMPGRGVINGGPGRT